MAKASDSFYKYIAAGKCESFWKKHIKTYPKGKETYSDEFYHLVNQMIQYNPSD